MCSSQIRIGAPCKPLTWPLPAEFMSRYRMQCVNNNFLKNYDDGKHLKYDGDIEILGRKFVWVSQGGQLIFGWRPLG